MKADDAAQLTFEELYDKNQLMKRLRAEFNVEEVHTQCERAEIPLGFGIDLLAQMVLHKRANVDVLIGILYRHFEDQENPFQSCADALIKAMEFDFVDYSDIGQTFIIRNDIDPNVQEDLDRFQYPLPMLVTPLPLNQNNQSGYLKVQGSVILRDNYHEDDVCLDHINRVNRVMLTINTDTATLIKNKWRNLDKQKPGEEWQDFQKRKNAFQKYDKTSRDVIDHLVLMDNEFYLTHRYDKRGRTYCQGYHVNYQGTAWNKAVVEFAHQEICQ